MLRGLSRVGKKPLKFSLRLDVVGLAAPVGAGARHVSVVVVRGSRTFGTEAHELLGEGRWHDPVEFTITLYRDKKGGYQGKGYKLRLLDVDSSQELARYTLDAAQFATVELNAERTVELRPDSKGGPKKPLNVGLTLAVECSFLREAGPESDVSSLMSGLSGSPHVPGNMDHIAEEVQQVGADQDLSGFNDGPEEPEGNPHGDPEGDSEGDPEGDARDGTARTSGSGTRSGGGLLSPAVNALQAWDDDADQADSPAGVASLNKASTMPGAGLAPEEADALRGELARMQQEAEADRRAAVECEADLTRLLVKSFVKQRDVDEAVRDAGGRLSCAVLFEWLQREMKKDRDAREKDKHKIVDLIGALQEADAAVQRLEEELEDARVASDASGAEAEALDGTDLVKPSPGGVEIMTGEAATALVQAEEENRRLAREVATLEEMNASLTEQVETLGGDAGANRVTSPSARQPNSPAQQAAMIAELEEEVLELRMERREMDSALRRLETEAQELRERNALLEVGPASPRRNLQPAETKEAETADERLERALRERNEEVAGYKTALVHLQEQHGTVSAQLRALSKVDPENPGSRNAEYIALQDALTEAIRLRNEDKAKASARIAYLESQLRALRNIFVQSPEKPKVLEKEKNLLVELQSINARLKREKRDMQNTIRRLEAGEGGSSAAPSPRSNFGLSLRRASTGTDVSSLSSVATTTVASDIMRVQLEEAQETLKLSRQEFEVVVERLSVENEELAAKIAGAKLGLVQLAQENEELYDELRIARGSGDLALV